MADTGAIAAGTWFIGADITLRFEVFADTAHTACVDVSTYAMEYALRKGNDDADPKLITKTTGGGSITVTGIFNSVPASNTQRVLVSILAADTDAASAIKGRAGEYQHALWRSNAGNLTPLMYTDSDTPAVLTAWAGSNSNA